MCILSSLITLDLISDWKGLKDTKWKQILDVDQKILLLYDQHHIVAIYLINFRVFRFICHDSNEKLAILCY